MTRQARWTIAPLVALLLGGCASSMMAGSTDGLPSDIAARPVVAAVTNRKPADDPGKAPWFGTERGETRIVQMRLASPYLSGRFSKAAVGLGDWSIKSAEPVASLPAALASGGSGGRDVLIYVHGFNQSFERAVLDAANLSNALGFRGDTVAFSWPSQNSVLSYIADRESAIWSRDALQETLETLLTNPGVGRVHIVAHSMGGMVTVEALRQVYGRTGLATGKLGAIVFAAPDIDLDSFTSSVERMGDLRRRMTVVSATDDRALAISASLAGGRRAGRIDKARLEELGITVVDGSGLSRGLLRHDLFLSQSSVQEVIARAIAQTSSRSVSAGAPVAAPPAYPAPAYPAAAPGSAPGAYGNGAPVAPAPSAVPMAETSPVPARP